ncbi:unnamed protein product [Malus baccata var. baccata]
MKPGQRSDAFLLSCRTQGIKRCLMTGNPADEVAILAKSYQDSGFAWNTSIQPILFKTDATCGLFCHTFFLYPTGLRSKVKTLGGLVAYTESDLRGSAAKVKTLGGLVAYAESDLMIHQGVAYCGSLVC